jgi:hypothetical protein
MSAVTASATSTAARTARRVAWSAGALFWTAFAVLEGVNHGWLAAGFAVAFFIAPDLTFLAGLRDARTTERGQLPVRAVPYYNAAHRALIPFALMIAYALGPIAWPPIFAGLCGWMAHIAVDRAFGYGLRTKEGFQRS